MDSGVCFLSHALRGELIAIVPGVVSVGPTIFSGFVAPYIVREVLRLNLLGLLVPHVGWCPPPFLLVLPRPLQPLFLSLVLYW